MQVNSFNALVETNAQQILTGFSRSETERVDRNARKLRVWMDKEGKIQDIWWENKSNFDLGKQKTVETYQFKCSIVSTGQDNFKIKASKSKPNIPSPEIPSSLIQVSEAIKNHINQVIVKAKQETKDISHLDFVKKSNSNLSQIECNLMVNIIQDTPVWLFKVLDDAKIQN